MADTTIQPGLPEQQPRPLPATTDKHRLSDADLKLDDVALPRRSVWTRQIGLLLLVVALFVGGVWVGAQYFNRMNASAGDGQSLNHWKAKLSSPDPNERVRGVHGLGRMARTNRKVIPVLQHVAEHDADDRVRTAAFRTLRDVDPQSVRHIRAPGGVVPAELPRPAADGWGD